MAELCLLLYKETNKGKFMSLGPGEITALLVVVLLIFGPSKLPGLGRGIGEFFKNFKKEVKDVQRDVEETKQQLKS